MVLGQRQVEFVGTVIKLPNGDEPGVEEAQRYV